MIVLCKGIILVGGSGIWFYFVILVVSKQFLFIYDKLMIYYLLIILMFGGMCEILIILMLEDILCFKQLLGDGLQWGIVLEYVVQFKFEGLVQVFLIGEDFV